MSNSRRQFLATSSAALAALALPPPAHAASAASSRLYASSRSIQEIARGLVLGVGSAVWRYVKGLDPAETRRFLEQFDAQRFRAQLETLQGQIDVEFDSLVLAIDLARQGDGTRVYTSLWSDVCIGRREGPLVRRIAEREIHCREATFLAQIEREVQLLVNDPEHSRINQMIPELIRRIAEG